MKLPHLEYCTLGTKNVRSWSVLFPIFLKLNFIISTLPVNFVLEISLNIRGILKKLSEKVSHSII